MESRQVLPPKCARSEEQAAARLYPCPELLDCNSEGQTSLVRALVRGIFYFPDVVSWGDPILQAVSGRRTADRSTARAGMVKARQSADIPIAFRLCLNL